MKDSKPPIRKCDRGSKERKITSRWGDEDVSSLEGSFEKLDRPLIDKEVRVF